MKHSSISFFLVFWCVVALFPDMASATTNVKAVKEAPTATGAASKNLGVWAGTLSNHLAFEAFLGNEVSYTSQKIGLKSWNHAKDVSLWIAEEFAPIADRACLALIFDLLPKDGSTTFGDVINGSHDDDLRTIARNLISGGHEDAILRLMHEADRPPNSWTFRNGNAADFIATWRHVHDVMMEVPGAEFQWQYSLDGHAGRQLKENGVLLTELGYPGDDYVDSVSIGNYDRGQYAHNWMAVEEKLNFIRDFATSHNLKMDIAEWGLWLTNDTVENIPGGGGDNPSFIKNTLDWFQALPAEQQGYLLYYNIHPSVNLNQFPRSEAMFRELFGSVGGVSVMPQK